MRSLRRPRHGAALLLAMVILTLVSTLAAAMVWQQRRAVQVEAAERGRAQGTWLLAGMLDFGRLILRLDARTPGADHLGEPWATKLEEASLAGLLAQDRNNTYEGAPEAYVTGTITDAQGRYNLRNLVGAEFKIVEAELETLKRLCETASVAPETANLIATGLQAAWQPASGDAPAATASASLPPHQLAQLAWLGLDADTVARLRPLVSLLPEPTPLNLNTASREVLASVIPGLDLSSAQRIVQQVQRAHFKNLEQARAYIPGDAALDPKRLGVSSNYFEVTGRLRLEGRAIEEIQLVVRRSREVVPLWRSRQVLQPSAS
jgi:general secretion pathway protein K